MIIYRQAVPSDALRILSLLEEIMEHHGVVPPEPKRLSATVSTIIAASDHIFLVAQDEDDLVGMCALVFSESTWSASPVCELQDVVVAQEHRRAEVGRGLMQTAEEVARARGCDRLYLLAEYWNLDAHAFYRSLGLAEKTCLYFERDLRADPPSLP
ncbi:MAG: GNAT family N-acetyltransferase [Thermoleophilia bacterium]|nr:GNAT family N-acetyltransferase [Thermoleophilia bacterium]